MASSLAGSISYRRLARAQLRGAAVASIDEHLVALESVGYGDSGSMLDAEALRKVASRLHELADKVVRAADAVEAEAANAATSSPPHITLLTNLTGDALQRSKDCQQFFESFGCTVYNPNLDAGGNTLRDNGPSNWMHRTNFRENGLERSQKVHGMAVHLRDPSRASVSEDGLLQTAGSKMPVIGLYGKISAASVAKALDLSRRQWERGCFNVGAVSADAHEVCPCWLVKLKGWHT